MTIKQTFQTALQHQHAGRLSQAEDLYRQVLAHQPKHVDALLHLGVVVHLLGRNEAAVDLTRQAIALKPDYAQAYSNLGLILKKMAQLEPAIAAFRQAIALKPNYPDAHYNLGIALRENGQMDQAITAYRQAILLKPQFPQAYNRLAFALRCNRQLPEAIVAYRQAIALKPDYHEAHYNLGNSLKADGQMDQAIAAYRQAIFFKPDFVEAYSNLGNLLKDVGQLEESISLYRQAIALKPDCVQAHSNLIFSAHFRLAHDAQAIADEQSRWNRQHAQPLKQFIQPHTNDRSPQRRLRVGYVSPDFRQHPVGRFVLALLGNHDPAEVEVFGYAQVGYPDSMTDRIRALTHHWRSTIGLSHQQLADQIRQDQIDILVDLAGHTAGNRLLVFARKPAPVQVTWLGYPNSTGLEAMDYRLTDAFADPPGVNDALCSEKLIRLPQTAWCFTAPQDNLPLDPAITPPITFGCFNNFSKITTPILKLWAQIMRSTPGSRLSIKARALQSPGAAQIIRQTMETAGVTPDRLDLQQWRQSHDEHLASYRQLHIALDTFPYHGTTTTCEALWTGVPVVTLAGTTHVSRVGVSLLTNIGLPELVAKSEEDYVRLAVELAHDLPRLTNLRSTLRQRMEQSPLMNALLFARNIESAYRRMWQTWCLK